MPKISAVRRARLKRELLNPKNTIKSAMLRAGFARSTAEGKNSNTGSVKVCQAEILAEINRPELIKKAYATLTRNLVCEENRNVEVSAAQSILRFTEGDRLLSVNITLDEQRKLVRDSLQELTEVKLT